MNELFLKYAYHIDNLRIDARIKTKDFCEGVCEPRTYRYYLSGQRVMTQKALNGFCEKLGFTPAEFYMSYNRYDTEEYQEIVSLYFHIIRNEMEPARKKFLLYDEKHFTNLFAKSIFDYCVIEYNKRTNAITKEHALDLYRKLINYPECLSKKNYTLQDTLTLQSIAMLEHEIGEDTAIKFLEKLLTNPEYRLVSSEDRDILPNIYATIAFLAGMKRDYITCAKVAKKGIDYCLSRDTIWELDNLYYYYMFSMFKRKDDIYLDYIDKYMSVLIIKYDKDYINSKVAVLERDGIVEVGVLRQK